MSNLPQSEQRFVVLLEAELQKAWDEHNRSKEENPSALPPPFIDRQRLESIAPGDRARVLRWLVEIDHYQFAKGNQTLLLDRYHEFPDYLDRIGEHLKTLDPTEIAISGYRLEAVIGKGGMGVVYRAYDTTLGRHVAIKVIGRTFSANAKAAERFETEARACARLTHDNIVKIYEVGEDDGRSYLSMELVEGSTLRDRIAERPVAINDAVTFVHTIARAIHAAHEQGVIHRDLKPANVLITRDGTLKVSDFGLAKLLERDASLTQTGEQIGTPFYMSPEQAEGRQSEIGPSTDVYAIGVILYEILTGGVPFYAEKERLILKKVIEDEPQRPRKQNRHIPKDLETICLKCLEKPPKERYATADALADDLRLYLEGKPIKARPVGRVKRIGKWCRRNRLLSGLIGTAALLVIVAFVALWRFQQGRIEAEVRSQNARENIEASLARAADLRRRYQFAAASTLLKQAEGQLDQVQSPASLAKRINQARADLWVVRRLDEIQLRKATWGPDGMQFQFANGRDGAYAVAFRAYGIDIFAADLDDIGDRVAASEVTPSLLAALDDWAMHDSKHRQRILSVARRADTDQLQVRLRTAASFLNRKLLLKVAGSAIADRLPANTLRSVASRLAHIGEKSAATDLFVRAAARHPNDFWLQLNTGDALGGGAWAIRYAARVLPANVQAQRLKACGYLRAAIALRKNNATAHGKLGLLLSETNQLRQAEFELGRAIALRPGFAEAFNNLGNLLKKRRKWKDAERAFRQAIAIDSKLAAAYNNLGELLHERRRSKEAEKTYLRAIQLAPKLVAAHINLGNLYRDAKRWESAESAYRRTIAIDSDFAPAYSNLGRLLHKMKRLREAETALRRAIKLDRYSVAAYNNLGILLKETDRTGEAEAVYRHAIKLDPTFAEAHGNLATILQEKKQWKEAEAAFRRCIQFDPNRAESHNNFGSFLRARKRLDAAESAFRRAIQLDPQSARAYSNLGSLLQAKRRLKEAEQTLLRATKLDPNLPHAFVNLGNLLQATHRYQAAEKAFRRAIEIDPTFVKAHMNLGRMLQIKRRYRQAEAALRRTIELAPKFALAHSNLGVLLAATNRPKEAEAAYRKAIQCDPSYARAYYNLGVLLRKTKRPNAAEVAYRRAIALDPDSARAHNNLGILLKESGRISEAVAVLRRAVKADPGFAIAHNNLGTALNSVNQTREAEAAYRSAIRWNPRFIAAHINLGNLYRANDRMQDAEKSYRRAAQLAPNSPTILCRFGLFLMNDAGQFAEAERILKRGHDLGTLRKSWNYPSRKWLAQATQLARLDDRLRDLPQDKTTLAPTPAAALARFALTRKRRPRTALALFETAFKNPAFTSEQRFRYQFDAARAAILSANGSVEKGLKPINTAEAKRLRLLALGWLVANLTATNRFLEKKGSRSIVVHEMRRWITDKGLVSVRGEGLERLPMEEQNAWRELWSNVRKVVKSTPVEAPRPRSK